MNESPVLFDNTHDQLLKSGKFYLVKFRVRQENIQSPTELRLVSLLLPVEQHLCLSQTTGLDLFGHLLEASSESLSGANRITHAFYLAEPGRYKSLDGATCGPQALEYDAELTALFGEYLLATYQAWRGSLTGLYSGLLHREDAVTQAQVSAQALQHRWQQTLAEARIRIAADEAEELIQIAKRSWYRHFHLIHRHDEQTGVSYLAMYSQRNPNHDHVRVAYDLRDVAPDTEIEAAIQAYLYQPDNPLMVTGPSEQACWQAMSHRIDVLNTKAEPDQLEGFVREMSYELQVRLDAIMGWASNLSRVQVQQPFSADLVALRDMLHAKLE